MRLRFDFIVEKYNQNNQRKTKWRIYDSECVPLSYCDLMNIEKSKTKKKFRWDGSDLSGRKI
jgi:hypothetical protein